MNKVDCEATDKKFGANQLGIQKVDANWCCCGAVENVEAVEDVKNVEAAENVEFLTGFVDCFAAFGECLATFGECLSAFG
jgi:hypothetical protein